MGHGVSAVQLPVFITEPQCAGTERPNYCSKADPTLYPTRLHRVPTPLPKRTTHGRSLQAPFELPPVPTIRHSLVLTGRLSWRSDSMTHVSGPLKMLVDTGCSSYIILRPRLVLDSCIFGGILAFSKFSTFSNGGARISILEFSRKVHSRTVF